MSATIVSHLLGRTWANVCAHLETHHGPGACVAVSPCSSIQLAEPVGRG